MKNLLIILGLTIIMFSCKTCPPQERIENRIARNVEKAEECGYDLHLKDTIKLPKVVYKDSLIMSPVDTSMIDSLLLELAKTPDSIPVEKKVYIVKKVRDEVLSEYKRSIEADTLTIVKIDTISKSGVLYLRKDSTSVWIKDGVLTKSNVENNTLIVEKDIVVNDTRRTFWQRVTGLIGGSAIWTVIIVAVLIGIFILGNFVKGKIGL